MGVVVITAMFLLPLYFLLLVKKSAYFFRSDSDVSNVTSLKSMMKLKLGENEGSVESVVLKLINEPISKYLNDALL
ncbi:MAG: hypothetical protein COC16_00700 [Lutibacter sp.]|nr:MAG: hypothetical protein COC16_00700 [Lutibacter sp.]